MIFYHLTGSSYVLASKIPAWFSRHSILGTFAMYLNSLEFSEDVHGWCGTGVSLVFKTGVIADFKLGYIHFQHFLWFIPTICVTQKCHHDDWMVHTNHTRSLQLLCLKMDLFYLPIISKTITHFLTYKTRYPGHSLSMVHPRLSKSAFFAESDIQTHFLNIYSPQITQKTIRADETRPYWGRQY